MNSGCKNTIGAIPNKPGDKSDFGEFTEYRGYLLLLAKTDLSQQYGGKFDESDIVQKTLLNAYTARKAFRGKTAGERIAWLKKILAHQIAQATRELKTKKRNIKREQSIEALLDASSMRLGSFLAANQSSPSQQALRHENICIVANAIDRLPDLQRQVVILRFWKGMSMQQAAEVVGKSTAATTGLQSRGLRNLRGFLAEMEQR